MKFNSQEDYLKEIAEEINKGKCYEIDNPTVEDILKLGNYDYIVSEGAYFPVIIRKRRELTTILNIPTMMFYEGYEVGDNMMGIIPETYSAKEALEVLAGFKNDIEEE